MPEEPLTPQFYVDPITGEVSEGKKQAWQRRMGPYPSHEAAEHAFELAKSRNEQWDETDREWRED